MKMSQINYWEMKGADTLNADIAALPKAVLKDVFDENGAKIEGWKRTEVWSKLRLFSADYLQTDVVDIPSDKYVLKQHEETFRPVIEGLTVSGVRDFNYILWNNTTRASLNIMIGSLDEGGIRFGFRVSNSFDRTSTINYGLKAQQEVTGVEIVQKDKVLVWGMRQVCSNGMVIRVPLKVCKYLDAVEVTKIKDLLSRNESIRHKGATVDVRIADMQYITEAFLMLRNPMNKMIYDAQKLLINQEKANELLEVYVGKRKKDRLMQLYSQEEQTLWGLYNAVTHYASHEGNVSATVREKVLLQGADLLEKELLIAAPSM